MSGAAVRAVVLCAGLGTRLRPLTESIPKPLLPVRGRSLVARTLDRLAAAGVEQVAVNLHHRAAEIRRAVGDRWGALDVVYSEEPEILGTLGAVAALHDFLEGAEQVVLLNGDSLCEWPVEALLSRHRGGRASATLLFSSVADPGAFGGFRLDDDERVVAFASRDEADRASHLSGTPYVFAGAHVFGPRLVADREPRFSGIVDDLYRPMLDQGLRLDGFLTALPWHDLGTAGRYLVAALAQGTWVSDQASVAADAELRTVVVEADGRVGRSVLERCLVLPGARVGDGARLREVVVGPGVVVPEEARHKGVMLTGSGPDYQESAIARP